MRSYFYLKNGKVTGPVEGRDIRKLITLKKISGFDLIYRNDEKKWKPVMEFPEMQEEFEGERIENPDDEVTGSFDLDRMTKSYVGEKSHDSLPKIKKQWVVLRILDRHVHPIKTEQVGPLSTQVIQKMIRSGDLSFQDYVWTDGMKQWGLLVEQEELVPKKDLPHIITSLTIEETVRVPEEDSDLLLASVMETNQKSDVEDVPEEAGKVILDSTDPMISIADSVLTVSQVTEPKFREVSKKPLETKKLDKNPSKKRVLTDTQKPVPSLLKFRLLQGIFGAFVIGGVVGIAFFLSHPPREMQEFELQDEVPAKPQAPVHSLEPPVKNGAATSQIVKPPPPRKTPDPPKPPPRKAPSYIKLQLKDVNGSSPMMIVETDASHHYSAHYLITGAAGQILRRPSYHREWKAGLINDSSKAINFRRLGLGSGWYTVVVNIEDKRALKTFFIGKKSSYRSSIRSHRKNLSYQHQEEKEEMYFIIRDLLEAIGQLRKGDQRRQMNSADFSRVLKLANTTASKGKSSIRKRLKLKNEQLWTVYWIQMEAFMEQSKKLINDVERSSSSLSDSDYGLLENEGRKLFNQIQELKVTQ